MTPQVSPHVQAVLEAPGYYYLIDTRNPLLYAPVISTDGKIFAFNIRTKEIDQELSAEGFAETARFLAKNKKEWDW